MLQSNLLVLLLITLSCLASQDNPEQPWPAGTLVRNIVLEIGLTNQPSDPYGFLRPIMTVNGTSPGPTINVTEGEWLSVLVLNTMPYPTSVHWHGLFMANTTYMDGVPGVSQCPIPPGGNLTYRFEANPAGTFWYHSHYDNQYIDGIYGALLIHPADGEYYADDYDYEWVLLAQDWYSQPAARILPFFLSPNSGGNEPVPDAIVVNGHFSTPLYQPLTFPAQPGDRVRIRFINAAGFSMFNFTIDGLPMQVIEVDGTTVEPYWVSYFVTNVAQRVSVIVDTALLEVDVPSIWFHVSVKDNLDMYPPPPPNTAFPPYEPFYYTYTVNDTITDFSPFYLDPDFVGVIDFSNGLESIPSYTPPLPMLPTPGPGTTNILDARPIPSQRAPNATHFLLMEIEFYADDEGVNLAHWNHFSYPMDLVNAEQTVFEQYANGGPAVPLEQPTPFSSEDYPGLEGSDVPKFQYEWSLHGNSVAQYYLPYNAVVDILINNTDTGEHPIHFHSHNFWIIATSDQPDAVQYSDNWSRRDTVSIPLKGWALIRVQANNPGVWAFHCHIEWHVSSGLFALMVEAPEQFENFPYEMPDDFQLACQAISTDSEQESGDDDDQELFWGPPVVAAIVCSFIGGALLGLLGGAGLWRPKFKTVGHAAVEVTTHA